MFKGLAKLKKPYSFKMYAANGSMMNKKLEGLNWRQLTISTIAEDSPFPKILSEFHGVINPAIEKSTTDNLIASNSQEQHIDHL